MELDIMTRLFTQKKAWEMELAANARENREAGRIEGQADMLHRLLQKFSLFEVSQIVGLSEEDINKTIHSYINNK